MWIWRLMCVLNPSERRKVQLSTEVELELLLTTSNIPPRAPIMLKGFWADDQAVIFQVVFAFVDSSTWRCGLRSCRLCFGMTKGCFVDTASTPLLQYTSIWNCPQVSNYQSVHYYYNRKAWVILFINNVQVISYQHLDKHLALLQFHVFGKVTISSVRLETWQWNLSQ